MKEWRSATVLADDLVGHLVNRPIESSRFDCSIKEMNGWTGEVQPFISPVGRSRISTMGSHIFCTAPNLSFTWRWNASSNNQKHNRTHLLPTFGKNKMKRCTGEKRAAVTVIPLLASTRKKKRKMNNTFHCRPLQTGNKRIPYSICIFHTSNELGRCFPTLRALPRYHSTHTQN